MKNAYTKGRGEYDVWDTDNPEELYEKAESSPFHVGQSYVDEPVPMLICRKCGGKEFNVGSSDCFTAIRCPACEWEICIHDG